MYDLGVMSLNPTALKRAREARGQSVAKVVAALCERNGYKVLHENTLKRWERQAMVRFDYNAIMALAAYYGEPIDAFLQRVSPANPTPG